MRTWKIPKSDRKRNYVAINSLRKSKLTYVKQSSNKINATVEKTPDAKIAFAIYPHPFKAPTSQLVCPKPQDAYIRLGIDLFDARV